VFNVFSRAGDSAKYRQHRAAFACHEVNARLVRPLGFSLDDRQLKRAGLDYWEDVDVKTWDSLEVLLKSETIGLRYFS